MQNADSDFSASYIFMHLCQRCVAASEYFILMQQRIGFENPSSAFSQEKNPKVLQMKTGIKQMYGTAILLFANLFMILVLTKPTKCLIKVCILTTIHTL